MPASVLDKIMAEEEERDGVKVVVKEDGSQAKRVKIKSKEERDMEKFTR